VLKSSYKGNRDALMPLLLQAILDEIRQGFVYVSQLSTYDAFVRACQNIASKQEQYAASRTRPLAPVGPPSRSRNIATPQKAVPITQVSANSLVTT